MTNSGGRLTVLTTLSGIKAVKTFTRRGTDKKVHVEGYGLAKRFKCREIDADDEGNWLRKLLDRENAFVVLGEPVDWPRGEVRRRLSEDNEGDAKTLRDVPRSWMPVDVDHLNFEPWSSLDDGETFAIETLEMLGLRGTRCLWQLTGSHAVEGRYRIRLWLSLSKPVTCAAMKAYARRWRDLTVEEDGKQRACVDTSILRPAQPIYTGTPCFVGMDDPVETRVGIVEGRRLRVKNVEVEERGDDSEDPNVARLKEAGLYIKAYKPGQHMIVCPWEDGHSGDAKDNDTFYYEPNFGGKDYPIFRCFHESCQTAERWWKDVQAKYGWTDSFERVSDSEERDDEEEFVYVHRLEQFWDPRDGALITTKAFDSMNGHVRRAGKNKGSPTDAFLASSKTRKVDAMAFLPGEDRVVSVDGVKVLNTYIDKRLAPDPDADATPWTEHLEWLVPDEREREKLMDWMAWTYQHPGEKITWAVILYGVPGTGKTSVFNCLAECLGHGYMSEPTQSEIDDRFNEWAHGKLLVKIEELMSGDRYTVAEKLKPIVANPTISIRAMHKSGFAVKNVSNVCASTNHIKALPIERGDRRYMLIQCVDAPKQRRAPHMRQFHRWLAQAGHGGIARWLSERDVSRFRPRGEAPETQLKRVVMEASMTDVDRACDILSVFNKEDLVTSTAVRSMLEANELKFYGNALGTYAYKLGWKSLPGQLSRVRHGKERITLWTPTGRTFAIEQVREMEAKARDSFLNKLDAKNTFQAIEDEKGDGNSV